MNSQKYIVPQPIIDYRESNLLEQLTDKYNEMLQPSRLSILAEKASAHIPEKVKDFGSGIKQKITEQELYEQAMKVATQGFKSIEELAAKHTISQANIIKKVNSTVSDFEITAIDEFCFARSYDISRLVETARNQNMLYTIAEGGATGALGFAGLPFSLVLSTLLYFRAVQTIAMFYGYDVKSNSDELIIASNVFINSISPQQGDENELGAIIGKIMIMAEATTIKQASAKTWADMASHGGIPLLLTQMRALANKSAKKALEKAGEKGIEAGIFTDVFTQIGRKLSKEAIGKSVIVLSAIFGALFDTAEMKKVLDYANIFYHKRFILEKSVRINEVMNGNEIIIVE